MSSLMIVLTTFPADGDAASLARTLIEERLAACVSILPLMQSIYRWKGAVEEATERQLVIKTSLARFEKLTKRLTELHPYDLPEIVALTAIADKAYMSWLGEQTRP